MNLPPVFKPTYVDDYVIAGDDVSKDEYFRIYVDGGMLNNFPIRAFDNIRMSGSFQYLSDLKFRNDMNSGNGGFAIASDPFEASKECEGLLGIRLEEKVNEDVEITEQASYPTDHLVFGRFLSELFGTFMYCSEKGQIRNLADKNKTVSLYASVKISEDDKLLSLKKYLEIENNTKYSESDFYTISVNDFATIAIETMRGRTASARAKTFLVQKAREQFASFLEGNKND